MHIHTGLKMLALLGIIFYLTGLVYGQGCLSCHPGLEQKCCKRFRLCCPTPTPVTESSTVPEVPEVSTEESSMGYVHDDSDESSSTDSSAPEVTVGDETDEIGQKSELISTTATTTTTAAADTTTTATTTTSTTSTTITTITTTETIETPKPKWGYCPVDRFAGEAVKRTVCLRRVCTHDSECSFIQKCCPFGETKCCVYPMYHA